MAAAADGWRPVNSGYQLCEIGGWRPGWLAAIPHAWRKYLKLWLAGGFGRLCLSPA